MHRFANLYLVLFLTDAGLSLLDELLKVFSEPAAPLSELRYLVAILVIALSMVLYAFLGVDRRLPKRIFLPMTLYISWCALAMWPLAGVTGRAPLAMTACVGQLLLGGLILLLLRVTGGQWLLSREHFRAPLFSLRNTLGFTAVNLLLLPLMLVYTGLAMASYFLEQNTAGFLRVSPVGIYLAERSYHLDDKVVRLMGMMHVGKEDYYEDLAGSMPSQGTIILSEGVTDRDKLLEHEFNYSRLAGIIGLSSQTNMKLDANPIEIGELGERPPEPGATGKPDIARADIDLNRFDAQTVEFLNVLGRTLLSSRPLAASFAEYNVWVNENMTPQRIAGVMADILDKRNQVLIASMERSLEYYDTVIIPWGAMHMPAIEAAVLEQGFKPFAEHERLSLDFRTLPYAELWRKWSTRTENRL